MDDFPLDDDALKQAQAAYSSALARMRTATDEGRYWHSRHDCSAGMAEQVECQTQFNRSVKEWEAARHDLAEAMAIIHEIHERQLKRFA